MDVSPTAHDHIGYMVTVALKFGPLHIDGVAPELKATPCCAYAALRQ
jgi:hypothetical protein